MIRHADVKILIEGLELKSFTSITLYYGTRTAPSLQLTTALVKNIRKLLPGTVVQVFIRSVSEDPNWFLLYEGYLSKIVYYRTDASQNATLITNGTESIIEKYRHAKYSIMDPIAGIASDVVFGNVGARGKVQATIPFRSLEGTGISKNFLSIEQWNSFIESNNDLDSSKSYTPGGVVESGGGEGLGGFPSFVHNVLLGITQNNPYIKIISDSLKFIDKYKIYPNSTIYKLALQVEAFKDLRNNLLTSTAPSYKDTLDSILNVGFARLNYLGVPGLNKKNEIVSAFIIPSNYYLPPPIYNMILLDEYRSYQINFNFDNEPTRALNTSFSSNIGAALGLTGSGGTYSALPTFLAPVSELLLEGVLKEDGKVQYYIKFTEEEKYRGLNPMIISSNAYEASYALLGPPDELSNIILTEEQLEKETTKRAYLNGAKGLFERMLYITESGYLRERLKSRGIGTITVPYFNPNWLIGFPGFLLTPEHGPILVNFDSVTININANGTSTSTLNVNHPRFLDDTISMDWPAPTWYDDYMKKENVGKSIYADYAKYPEEYKNGASVTDFFGTTEKEDSIEEAARLLEEVGEVEFEKRKRKFVDNATYFNFLKVKTDINGFPNPSITEYREAKNLDALTIVSKTDEDPEGKLGYLECPYVVERAKKVAEWMGLNVDFIIGKDFTVPDPIDPDKVNLESEANGTTELISQNIEKNKKVNILAKLAIVEIADDIVLRQVDGVSSKFNLKWNRAGTVNDLKNCAGKPGNQLPEVNLSENLVKFLVRMYNGFPSGKVTKVISAHSPTTVSGTPSAHQFGKAVDLVAVDANGIPNVNLTTSLRNWIQNVRSEFGITNIVWHPKDYGTDPKSTKGAHSPIGEWGMHIHIGVRS